MLCYWQEDGGSLLTTSFMAITEQRHKVPKLSERIFAVKNFCDFCDFCVTYNFRVFRVFRCLKIKTGLRLRLSTNGAQETVNRKQYKIDNYGTTS